MSSEELKLRCERGVCLDLEGNEYPKELIETLGIKINCNQENITDTPTDIPSDTPSNIPSDTPTDIPMNTSSSTSIPVHYDVPGICLLSLPIIGQMAHSYL